MINTRDLKNEMKKAPEVVLVSTRHVKLGVCNSIELLKIIESIEPDVIFIEQPPSYYKKYYVDKSITSLETEAVKAYRKKSDFELVLVDSDNIPKDKFFDDYKSVIEKIEGQSNINGYEFRNLLDDNKYCIHDLGFEYLNKRGTLDFNLKFKQMIEEGLNLLNNPELIKANDKWNEVQDVRENHMLEEIYNYSSTQKFSKAIFLLGAGHRNSIINKISNLKLVNPDLLSWRW